MRKITEIVVHCSATHEDWQEIASIEEKRAIIRKWHIKRKWKREGYHHFIDRNGDECAGRPDSMQGAGVRGHNRGRLHVCLIGGHGSAATDLPLENFTPEQMARLRAYVKHKMEQYPSIKRVSGHNEYANKACPGFDVPTWWNAPPKRRFNFFSWFRK